MSNGPTFRDDVTRGDIATKTRSKTQRPSLYKVLLLNDDYTPMEFVVHVLERFFGKTPHVEEISARVWHVLREQARSTATSKPAAAHQHQSKSCSCEAAKYRKSPHVCKARSVSPVQRVAWSPTPNDLAPFL